MLLIILTLCSQPIGFVTQEADVFTIYPMEAAAEVVPNMLPKITSEVIVPIDGLTKTGRCA